jgi:hypothetical protein
LGGSLLSATSLHGALPRTPGFGEAWLASKGLGKTIAVQVATGNSPDRTLFELISVLQSESLLGENEVSSFRSDLGSSGTSRELLTRRFVIQPPFALQRMQHTLQLAGLQQQPVQPAIHPGRR